MDISSPLNSKECKLADVCYVNFVCKFVLCVAIAKTYRNKPYQFEKKIWVTYRDYVPLN